MYMCYMKRSTKLLYVLALVPMIWGAQSPANAAELVMVEEQGCMWCDRWNDEIGVVYDKTDEGAVAPLRRVEIDALPADIRFASTPRYTPTFVLVDGGVEIGRIEGHPGEDFFWPLLNRLLDRLSPATTATN